MAEPENKTGILAWAKNKMAGFDVDKLQELYEHTKEAYNAEMSGQWEQAYELHSQAISLWSAYANTAGAFSRTDRVYKRLIVKRRDLHQQRLDTLLPFVKEGEPFPEKFIMHSSIRITALGLTERVASGEIATAHQHVAEKLALTLVCDTGSLFSHQKNTNSLYSKRYARHRRDT